MGRRKGIWYNVGMRRAEIDEVLDEIRLWPEERRERAARLLIELERAEADLDLLDGEYEPPASREDYAVAAATNPSHS